MEWCAYNDVAREAQHDWLAERPEPYRPSPSEYLDDPEAEQGPTLTPAELYSALPEEEEEEASGV